MEEQNRISLHFQGIRPIMFDRYPGDNNSCKQMQWEDRLYVAGGDVVCIPVNNVMSCLTAENTKSVVKVFVGRSDATRVRQAVNSYLEFDYEYPGLVESDVYGFCLPMLRDEKPITRADAIAMRFLHPIRVPARVKGGIPNVKDRPVVDKPWSLEFELLWRENKEMSVDELIHMLKQAGKIGLGTWRPQFGQFVVTATVSEG